MRGYPVFLDLEGRTCLVVGAGAVGAAKVRGLSDAGAVVRVVDPSPPADLTDLSPAVVVVQRAFRPEDADGTALVFACTPDPVVNRAVLAAAASRGVPACDAGTGIVVTEAQAFSSGAVLRRGGLCVAVSTGGASAGLAADVRDLISTIVGDEYADATELLRDLRERLAGVGDEAIRRRASRRVLDGGLVELLRAGRHADAAALVGAALDGARTESRCSR